MDNAQDISSLDRPLKEGERIVAPTRRPDGTMRKPIRIRAGYTPQDEVAIYQSKGALFRRGLPQVPPGYDPVDDSDQKQKTKAAKKNEKRKEKKHQHQAVATLHIGQEADHCGELFQVGTSDLQPHGVDNAEAVLQKMGSLSLSAGTSVPDSQDERKPEKVDLQKRIRALRKKIRLTESLQVSISNNPDQTEKLARLDIWRKELEELEARKGLL